MQFHLFDMFKKVFSDKEHTLSFIFGGIFMFVCMAFMQILTIARLYANGVDVLP